MSCLSPITDDTNIEEVDDVLCLVLNLKCLGRLAPQLEANLDLVQLEPRVNDIACLARTANATTVPQWGATHKALSRVFLSRTMKLAPRPGGE